MNNSAQHSNGPSPEQIQYLKDLAAKTGRSFAWPATGKEASAEIRKLLRKPKTSAGDRRRELREVQSDMASGRGGAARVRDDELSGYGSTGRWAGRS